MVINPINENVSAGCNDISGTSVVTLVKAKHKSPSKTARDVRRMRGFWERVCACVSQRKDIQTQTEGLCSSKSVSRNNIWTRITSVLGNKRNDAKTVSACDVSDGREQHENGGPAPQPLVSDSEEGQPCVPLMTGSDPREVYVLTENAMQLSRLEEEKNLSTALRHLVRRLHEGGRSISFPIPEAADRISLRCGGLPTDPGELLGLVLQVFARREEPFDLDSVYSDYVRFYGRVVFDSKQPWPHCYIVVRHS